MRRATFSKLYSPDDDGGVMPPSGPVPVAVVVPEPVSVGRVTCEGCGCSLDTRGAIIRRGDGLRAFMAREDEIDTLKKALDSEREKNRQLSARVAELEPAKKRSILY